MHRIASAFLMMISSLEFEPGVTGAENNGALENRGEILGEGSAHLKNKNKLNSV